MSAFVADLNIQEVAIAHPTQEQLDQGHPPMAHITLGVAMVTPIILPGGQQAAATVALGAVGGSLDRDQLRKLLDEAQAAYDALPAPSNLVTATSLSQVERLAQDQGRLTGQ